MRGGATQSGGALRLVGKAKHGSGRKRLFVGVRVPDHVQGELELAQDAIEAFFDGKPTPAENLHITLKFLGELDAHEADLAHRRLRRARLPEATARIDGYGSFSKRIAWARVEGLEELQRAVDIALEGMFEPERRFMSHLTIARIRHAPNPASLRAALAALVTNASWRVHEIELIESELSRAGARYRVIRSYPCRIRRGEERVLSSDA